MNTQIKMQFSKTNRGFARYDFIDLYGAKCSLQQSSLATDDALWLGCDEYVVHHVTGNICGRMHLNRDQVAALLPILHHFMMTGEVSDQPAYAIVPDDTTEECDRLRESNTELLKALECADFILTAIKGSEVDFGADMNADIDRDLAIIKAARARAAIKRAESGQ